jgi:Rieske Fe-S protein
MTPRMMMMTLTTMMPTTTTTTMTIMAMATTKDIGNELSMAKTITMMTAVVTMPVVEARMRTEDGWTVGRTDGCKDDDNDRRRTLPV